MNNELKFSDEVWVKVLQLVQLSMLTGTDVLDYLRQVTVTRAGSEGNLVLADSYKVLYEKTIDDLLARAEEATMSSEA